MAFLQIQTQTPPSVRFSSKAIYAKIVVATLGATFALKMKLPQDVLEAQERRASARRAVDDLLR